MSSALPIPGSRVLEELGRLHVQLNQQIDLNQQLAMQNAALQKQLQETLKENASLKETRPEDQEVISKHNYREAAETKQPS